MHEQLTPTKTPVARFSSQDGKATVSVGRERPCTTTVYPVTVSVRDRNDAGYASYQTFTSLTQALAYAHEALAEYEADLAGAAA